MLQFRSSLNQFWKISGDAAAYVYAAQTVKGAAAAVLACGKNPAALKDAVCSPGGTTIEGVAALEKGGFRSAGFDAVKAACEKSAAMSKR